MKKYLLKFSFIFFFFFTLTSYSQLDLSSEVGITFGVTSFQTDFGERYDFASANASSMSFGAVYFLKFYGSQYNWRSGTSYFSDHFKLKVSFDYINKTNIKHEEDFDIVKMQEMRGEIKMYDVGTQLEFYFGSLEDYSTLFSSKNKFNPYLSAGVHVNFYDPEVTSLLGSNDWRNFVIYDQPDRGMYDKWYLEDIAASDPNSYDGLDHEQTIFNESGTAFAVSVGAGLRYSMQYFDLMIDTRWQHFFSDKIDGLDASKDPGNKYNDTMVYLNFGIIYTFNRFY